MLVIAAGNPPLEETEPCNHTKTKCDNWDGSCCFSLLLMTENRDALEAEVANLLSELKLQQKLYKFMYLVMPSDYCSRGNCNWWMPSDYCFRGNVEWKEECFALHNRHDCDERRLCLTHLLLAKILVWTCTDLHCLVTVFKLKNYELIFRCTGNAGKDFDLDPVDYLAF